jgi:hypothetical protein
MISVFGNGVSRDSAVAFVFVPREDRFGCPGEIRLRLEGGGYVVDGRVGRRTMHRKVVQSNRPAAKSHGTQLVAFKVIIYRRRRVVTVINPSQRRAVPASRCSIPIIAKLSHNTAYRSDQPAILDN